MTEHNKKRYTRKSHINQNLIFLKAYLSADMLFMLKFNVQTYSRAIRIYKRFQGIIFLNVCYIWYNRVLQ